jgi:hypothetical protein
MPPHSTSFWPILILSYLNQSILYKWHPFIPYKSLLKLNYYLWKSSNLPGWFTRNTYLFTIYKHCMHYIMSRLPNGYTLLCNTANTMTTTDITALVDKQFTTSSWKQFCRRPSRHWNGISPHVLSKPSYTFIISCTGFPPPPSFISWFGHYIICNECKTIYINLYIFLVPLPLIKLSTYISFCNQTIRNVHFTTTFSNI